MHSIPSSPAVHEWLPSKGRGHLKPTNKAVSLHKNEKPHALSIPMNFWTWGAIREEYHTHRHTHTHTHIHEHQQNAICRLASYWSWTTMCAPQWTCSMFGAHVVVWGATVLSVCLCTKQVFLLLVSGIDTVKVPLNSTACFCLKVTQILVRWF